MSENCKTCKYHTAVDDGFMCDCEESENYWDWTSLNDSCPYHEKKESKNMKVKVFKYLQVDLEHIQVFEKK